MFGDFERQKRRWEGIYPLYSSLKKPQWCK